MKLRMIWMLLLGALLATVSVAQTRTWTATGGQTIDAEFVKVEDGKAHLKKADGAVIAVPLTGLIEADRQHIASLEKAAASPDAAPEPAAPAPAATGSASAAVAAAEPAPPAGQTYIGVKRCAPCHFKYYMTWKKDKHATTFELLTAKYEKDPKCLKCHTTGYGEPTGFKDMESTPHLANNQCENCHGPGSKHEEVSKPFANVKELTPEQEKTVRDSIWKLLPGTVCIDCHKTKAHEESPTPPEMRTKK